MPTCRFSAKCQETKRDGNVRETAAREMGWGSVYPLAGVLVDVHGLDERLKEAEKIGDPHRCAQTIES